jgi:hypothetical protein
MKRQPTEWEKTFASYIFDKGLITKIYRDFKKLTSQRISSPLKNKWASELNRQFSKEEVQMANEHKEMLNILVHKGNANQNYTEIPPHPSQNGYHQ